MAIKALYECPHCHETLTATRRPEKCPNPKCGYDFGDAITEYKYPVTLREQYERLLIKPTFYGAILDMPMEKANFIMNDALNIIETLPAKNVRASDIRNLVIMAIKIGRIATKYHEYIEAGGRHVPSLFFKEKEGDTQNDIETTTNGERPARGVTQPV